MLSKLVSSASDVYGLGAILYALLCGKPPGGVGNKTVVLDRVARGKILAPREVNSRVPRPLQAVCQKALSYEPERRYASARLLAQDVANWLADEPVSAQKENLAVRGWRLARRHKGWTAAVCMMVIGLAVVLWARDSSTRRVAAILREIEKIEAGRREATPDPHRVLELAQRAKDTVGIQLVSSQLRNRLKEIVIDYYLLCDLDDARMKKSSVHAKELQLTRDKALQEYPAAFKQRYNIEMGKTSIEEASKKIIGRRTAVREAIIAALDDWMDVVEILPNEKTNRAWLKDLVNAVDKNSLRASVRQAGRNGTEQLPQASTGNQEVLTESPLTLQVLARRLHKFQKLDKAISLLKRARERYPKDFWLNYDLAFYLQIADPPQLAEAIRFYTAAESIRPMLVAWAGFCASAGLWLGTVARTEAQASGLGVLTANLLAALGGCWWPIEITPDWMQTLQKMIPTGWTMDALHKLVSFGADPLAVLPNILILIVAAVVFGALAARRFEYA